MKKKVRIVLILLLTLVLLFIFFSPYNKKYYKNRSAIKSSIVINANTEDVFTYLGNSANAKSWSSYVEEIVPLNGHEIKDGELNSQRRCFKRGENKTVYWDEEIIDLKKNDFRKLSIFNITGFNISVDDLITQQHYASISPKQTKLTFSLYPKEESLADYFKLIFASYTVQSIFDKNLENIKKEVERLVQN